MHLLVISEGHGDGASAGKQRIKRRQEDLGPTERDGWWQARELKVSHC